MALNLSSLTLGCSIGAAVVGTGLFAQPATDRPAPAAQPDRANDYKSVVKDWPEAQRKSVEELVRMYGHPHEATPSRLTWFDTAPFEYTTIYREAVQHNFPMPHEDYIEQGIKFDVPPEKATEVLTYDGSVLIDRTKGRLAARCDKVPANFLALNLAHDVIEGDRSVDEARQEYADIIQQMMDGQTHQYLERLQFSVPAQAGDPDEAFDE